MRVNPSAPLDVRLWSRVLKSDGCWLWQGRTKNGGYGVIDRPRSDGASRPLLAHRVAYELTYGEVPDGLAVCHHCDTPPCVRPDHLFLGTLADNNADMLSKGRTARGESKRQKLTARDVAEIRQLWGNGGIMQKDIAARFSVSRGVISEIIARKSWVHVNP